MATDMEDNDHGEEGSIDNYHGKHGPEKKMTMENTDQGGQ